MSRPPQYKVIIQTGGETYEALGKTVSDAIEKIGLEWQDIKLKGIVTVRKGKQVHEHLFNVIQLRRIFGSKIIRDKWSRNLEFLTKEGPDSNMPFSQDI